MSIELTGRCYAAPWTEEDMRISFPFQRNPDLAAALYCIAGDGDKRDSDIMLSLTADPPPAAGTPPLRSRQT
jgi:hypothetical protein